MILLARDGRMRIRSDFGSAGLHCTSLSPSADSKKQAYLPQINDHYLTRSKVGVRPVLFCGSKVLSVTKVYARIVGFFFTVLLSKQSKLNLFLSPAFPFTLKSDVGQGTLIVPFLSLNRL